VGLPLKDRTREELPAEPALAGSVFEIKYEAPKELSRSAEREEWCRVSKTTVFEIRRKRNLIRNWL
jgi:hypothetical protein